MKKSLRFLVILSLFADSHYVLSAPHKVCAPENKSLKYHKKIQKNNTNKMFEDLYHRYPRKYSRTQPKRIEQDDFQ